MQIWVSSPLGAQLGGLAERLRSSWRMAAKYASADLHFVEPRRNEIHGELLSRLWITEIAQHEDPVHIISELDFQPYRQGPLRTLLAAQRRNLNFLYSQYLTRIYEPSDDVEKMPGQLLAHTHDNCDLVGAWYLFLDLRHPHTRDLPDDFLAQSGPYNDPANKSVAKGLNAGFLSYTPRNFASLKFVDGFPCFHGSIYPGVGRHFFFSRALDQPDDDVICWSHCRRPLTAGYHRQNVVLSCR